MDYASCMGETTFILIILMSGIFSTMEEDRLTLLIADYAKCRWQMFYGNLLVHVQKDSGKYTRVKLNPFNQTG